MSNSEYHFGDICAKMSSHSWQCKAAAVAVAVSRAVAVSVAGGIRLEQFFTMYHSYAFKSVGVGALCGFPRSTMTLKLAVPMAVSVTTQRT